MIIRHEKPEFIRVIRVNSCIGVASLDLGIEFFIICLTKCCRSCVSRNPGLDPRIREDDKEKCRWRIECRDSKNHTVPFPALPESVSVGEGRKGDPTP